MGNDRKGSILAPDEQGIEQARTIVESQGKDHERH